MHNRKRVPWSTVGGALLGVCALVFCSIGAVAQEAAPRAARPAPEPNYKAWELEARSVAQSLELSADLTTKLVDAYKAARESQMTAIRAKMDALRQAEGRPNYGALREVNEAEKAKLETALRGFLNPEQTTKALAPLGTFNSRWDSMAETLDGMNLEEKAKADAMKLVVDYVAESGALMQSAPPGGDFEALREKMAPLREKLDAGLAKILSAEQMTKWNEATTRRRGPRPSESEAPSQPAPAPAAPAPEPASK